MIRKRDLTWLESIYVVEIVKGLWITSKRFARNMFFHTMHKLGLMRHIRAMVTYEYPDEMRPMAERLRTRHRLTKREDGTPRCVGCMLCETVCPAYCISIVPEESPDPHIEKRAKSFTIDLGKCVYCGFCVEVCPEDAIRMDTERHDIAAYSREDMIYDMDRLLNR